MSLTSQVERIALSNLVLAGGYRQGLAMRWQNAVASTKVKTKTTTPRPKYTVVLDAAAPNCNKLQPQGHQAQRSKGEKEVGRDSASRKPSPPPSVPRRSRISWKRKEWALTSRRKKGGSTSGPSDLYERDFFNADKLSVCIASLLAK